MKRMVMGITLCGTLCGILACWWLAVNQLMPAFLAVIAAMVFDMIDGPLARRSGVVSQAGGWLDSVTDLCIYVVFPALFWWQTYGVHPVILALFVAAGAFRLVRFTLWGFEQQGAKLFYQGLPVFYSQFLLIVTYALRFDSLVLGMLLIAVAVLNVSTIPFAKLPVRLLGLGLALYTLVVVLRAAYVF